MVPQVSVIGTLMIINGVLCIIYGIVLMALGPFMQQFFEMQGAQAPPQAQQQMQQMQQMIHVFTVVNIVLGAASALAGVMNIAGGIAAMRFRGRTFVIIALFFNIAALSTCYCAPTSLGLMIWGLIAMFQKDVADAFTLGASGLSAGEIKDRFSRRGYHSAEDDDDWPTRRGRDESPDAGRPPSDRRDDGFQEL